MILNDTGQSGEFWAGYITDGGLADVSCAAGIYYNVPPTTYVGNGWPTKDVNSIWVGIGGDMGNSSMWQAGIYVNYTGLVGGGGYQNYWQPFTEALTASSNGVEWFGPTSSNFPSQLIITVCTSNGQNTAQIEAYYASTGGSLWWNETVSKFWPDTHTAEWIVEDPVVGVSHVPLGGFAPFGAMYPSWTDNGTYSKFLGPLTYLSLTDTAYGTQYVTAGQIFNGFNQFPITYST
ncbi:MAG: G1 family glutamic endopeptidase [Thermoplasmata archaeon]